MADAACTVSDSKDAGVDGLMKEKIEAYFERLGLPTEKAKELRHVSLLLRARRELYREAELTLLYL